MQGLLDKDIPFIEDPALQQTQTAGILEQLASMRASMKPEAFRTFITRFFGENYGMWDRLDPGSQDVITGMISELPRTSVGLLGENVTDLPTLGREAQPGELPSGAGPLDMSIIDKQKFLQQLLMQGKPIPPQLYPNVPGLI